MFVHGPALFHTTPYHTTTWHDTSKHTSTQWIDQSLVHRPRDSRFIKTNRQYTLVIDIDIDINDKGGNVTSEWNTNRHGKVGAVKNASYKKNETFSSRYYVTRYKMAYNSQSQGGWQDIKGGRVDIMLAVRGIKSGCILVQDRYNDTWTMSYASGISESGAQQSRMTPSHLNTRHSKNSVEQERGTFGWMDGISSRVPWLSMVHDTAPFHNMTIQYTNTPYHDTIP